MDFTSKPFDWSDPMAAEAIEAFDTIRPRLDYYTAQTIGMALAKLMLIEQQERGGIQIDADSEADS